MILRIVMYDIEDDKARLKMSKVLLSMGFTRIQKSVFCGMHPANQWETCRERLEKHFEKLGKESDSLYAFMIGKKNFEEMYRLGCSPDFDSILDRRLVLWI